MSADNSIDSTELYDIIALARERDRARPIRFQQWEYLRFTNTFKSIPEGTVVFGDTVVWGYPKIGRIFQLETGIAAQFENPLWVEEKIDGYNVRIFQHNNAILALTRRGYVCPFTTDRLDDLLDTRIVRERPDLVLCAEVAGPDNPYNEGSPPFIAKDVQLFVFDVMYKDRRNCIPYREKTQLLEEYGLPSVPQFGRYPIADIEKLRPLILRLDREGREGIVLKEDSERDHRAKYVTGSINMADIRVTNKNMQQLPAEYYMQRILRIALFMEEHGIEARPESQRELGDALVSGTMDAIRQYRHHHKVYRTYRCRFRQLANAQLMVNTMKRRLGKGQVSQRRLEKDGDFYLLEFDKVLPRTTGLFRHLLSGGIVFD